MKINKQIKVRRATADDAGNVLALQNAAFRIALRSHYETAEIDAYLADIGTAEPCLISSGTYFVAEIEGEIVASGGWQLGRTDLEAHLRSGALEASDAAFVHGVYTDPAYVACGLADMLLERIEDDIAAFGHQSVHVVTPYTGMPFFSAAGYLPNALISLELAGRTELHGVQMSKLLSSNLRRAA